MNDGTLGFGAGIAAVFTALGGVAVRFGPPLLRSLVDAMKVAAPEAEARRPERPNGRTCLDHERRITHVETKVKALHDDVVHLRDENRQGFADVLAAVQKLEPRK